MHSRSRVAAVALAALTVVGLVPAAVADSTAEPQPSIAAISPLAGRPSGGSSLTIRGRSLDPVTAVSFGGVRSRQITHTSADLISVAVPAHAVGVVRIRLVVHGAAGADSAAYRYAPPPTQLRWSRDRTIDPDVGDLAGLSCPTRRFCVSVEASVTAPALLTFAPNGRAHRSPIDLHAGLPAVSCTSASQCFALRHDGMSSRWNGRTWSGFRRVAPARVYLSGLSCVTGTQFCLAIGEKGATWVHRSSGWSRAAKLPHEGYESSLSCATARFCMLVTNGRAFRFDGSAWRAASRGLPVDLQYESPVVSCASATFCLLTGEYSSARWAGSRWWSTFGGLGTYGSALACASRHLCVLIGYDVSGVWRDRVWHEIHPVGRPVSYPGVSCPDARECIATIRSGLAIRRPSGWSKHYLERSGGELSDVSCTSAAWCMAVDRYGNAVGKADGTWQRPLPIDRRRAISSVSCAGRLFCVAVDGADPYDLYTKAGVGHAVVYRHGRWQAPAVVDPDHGLTDVACASDRMCIAVDDAGNALRWNGRRWSPPRQVGALLEAVACPSASRCIAVGRRSALWSEGRWHAIRNPAGTRQLTDVTCVDEHYCVAGGVGGFYVRHLGVWSDAIRRTSNLWQVLVACLSRSACFGSQDNQADVWDYAFDGSRVAFSAAQLYGPKMSCVPRACVAVSLSFTNSGRPI